MNRASRFCRNRKSNLTFMSLGTMEFQLEFQEEKNSMALKKKKKIKEVTAENFPNLAKKQKPTHSRS